MEISNFVDNHEKILKALGPLSSQVMTGEKMSHKTWRNVLKKLKRKIKRRNTAQQQKAEENVSNNEDASEDDAVAKEIERKESQLQFVEHARWLQREKKAHEEWLHKKWLEKEEKRRQEEQDERIRKEWEEQQKKEKEEKEKQELEEKKKKEKQEALLSEATANEKTTNGSQPWHNPLAPVYAKEAEVCSFFMKTGACRFGERCSRSHPDPDNCHTLMFPGMYTHMILDKSQDDYDTDLTLEFEEGEIYDDFKQFYEDVLPEFQNVGHVIQFKVSCNFEPHLRGNVYVQYKTEDEALKAYAEFNGRWYGGKQLSCQVVEIKKWTAAICGLYNENRCHKGKACNFLHVFRNPTSEFNRADRDFDSQFYPSRQYRNEGSKRYHDDSRYFHSSSRSKHLRRKRSSPSYYHSSDIRYSKKSRSRSRSKQRHKRSKSRSRSRQRYERSRSRSWSRSRPKHQARSRTRSKSPKSSKSSSLRNKKSSKKDSRRSRSHSKTQNSKSRRKSFSSSSSSSTPSSPNSPLL